MKLDEMERLARLATPGEWRFYTPNNRPTRAALEEFANLVATVAPQHQIRSNHRGGSYPSDDGRFIAAANPQTVLKLIALLQEAKLLMPASVVHGGHRDVWLKKLEGDL